VTYKNISHTGLKTGPDLHSHRLRGARTSVLNEAFRGLEALRSACHLSPKTRAAGQAVNRK